jgi:biopolymer transport protein ExbB
MTFAEIMDKGGVLMYPIFLCSIISLAALFERLWALRSSRVTPSLELYLHIAKTGTRETMIAEAQKRDDFLSQLLRQVLSDDEAADTARMTGIHAKRLGISIYRWVTIPGVMATVSPLLGLLGTVFGMIKIFTRFSDMGGNPLVLASGIWEALLTTAAGLSVAIPSLIIYRYILHRADRTAGELEFATERLLAYLDKK